MNIKVIYSYFLKCLNIGNKIRKLVLLVRDILASIFVILSLHLGLL